MTIEQLPLFPDDQPKTFSQGTDLAPSSSLTMAMERFRAHLVRQEYAENTVKSFLGDLRILGRYLKTNPPIGQISTKTLQKFLHWLQYERGKPCSSKSYARRLTTLKVFFAWLTDLGVLAKDPAAPLIHKPIQTPLPRILYDEQVDQVLAVTRQMMQGGKPDPAHRDGPDPAYRDKPDPAYRDKPDPRPHLLVTLLLHTGIKKRECMGIRLAHIDTSSSQGPVVHIRYDNPRMQYKERRLRLPPDWAGTLAHYRRVYEPQDYLFPCTARNLEYVLTNVAQQADLPDGLSFEMLRWTCALRDYQSRMEPERLRRKLGLSQMSWRETEPKIVRLAEPPL